jgi:hypothetical protein
MDQYNKAQKALFDHVGFVPDWVECAIDDCTDEYWQIDGDSVHHSPVRDQVGDDDGMQSYSDVIYTQRFYEKHVYRGDELTMIFCDPQVDSCKWFRVFDNSKEVKGAAHA